MIRLPLPETLGMLFVCPAGASPEAQHTAAHALLRDCLPEFAPELPAVPRMERTAAGKPYFPAHPELHFSLSHCKGLAACLLSHRPCGVDAEGLRHVKEGVLRRVFTPEEQRAVRNAPAPDLLFTRIWTMKEAYVKALGTGIAYPMQEIVIQPVNGTLRCDCTDCTFWHTVTEDGFAVSVCVRHAQQAYSS